MELDIRNWSTQIKKGYLDLCILTLINYEKKTYGFQIITSLKGFDILIKEGTLYPLLSRMTKDNILTSFWVTEDTKGHPRKFYSLTKFGEKTLKIMQEEYESMNKTYKKIKKLGENDER